MWQNLFNEVKQGNYKSLSRTISLVENEFEGYEGFLQMLPVSSSKIIGITGPPGAGKSTLTDALIEEILKKELTVGVICIDPTSPFNKGALLGDRIRMNRWYAHPGVYIRSLASRGSLGGLSDKIIEVTDVMKLAGFHYIIVETVGVGQSEVEIAGLADTTIVVLVPEAGDDIQTMKAGLMEVADIYVVNKADRPGADQYLNTLKVMLAPAFHSTRHNREILKVTATSKEGITALLEAVEKHNEKMVFSDNYYHLLAEKAYYLIAKKRMRDISKEEIFDELKKKGITNLYQFIEKFPS